MNLYSTLSVSRLVILMFFCQLGQSCNFAKFTPHHTMCKYRGQNPQCAISGRMISPPEAQEIVRIHNTLRQQIALGNEHRGRQPPASNMREMYWDDELARLAQRLADQCIFRHDCSRCREVERFNVGQNMASVASTFDDNEVDWKFVIKNWYDQVRLFRPNRINPFQFVPGTGHFSQVVWGDTYRVGCGFTHYYKNGKSMKLFVCNYGPTGNVLRSPMYKQGAPCSDCPGGTSCSRNYYGLCALGAEPPVITVAPPVRQILFACNFENDRECSVNHIAGTPWRRVKTGPYGSHFEVEIKRGESSDILLSEMAQIPAGERKVCLGLRYKKHPIGTDEAFEHPLRIFILSSHKDVSNFFIKEDSREWNRSFFSMVTDGAIFIGFHFTLLTQTSSSNYIVGIDDVFITSGAC
ncbi:venom allergen 3-like [Tachypleus tridentatus]|uniref:venom allergen 3-like n=1 Tax=Tachypleus tridentatus TaxID=6853 RepID=UPI003FCFDE1F